MQSFNKPSHPWRRRSGLRIVFSDAGKLVLGGAAKGAAVEISRNVVDLLELCDGVSTLGEIAEQLDWSGLSLDAKKISAERVLTRLEQQGFVERGTGAASAAPPSVYLSRYAQATVHRMLVGDRERTDSYRRAIHEIVRAGDTVVDVGSGTGVLAMFAAQAGAAVVHAIEPAPIVEQARQIARDNGFDQIEFHRADGATLDLGVRADVVIADWVGHFVVNERIFAAAAYQRDACLTSNGRMFPARVTSYIAPLCDPEWRESGPESWRDTRYGIDFSAMMNLEYAQLSGEPIRVKRESLLADPLPIRTFDCRDLSAGDLADFTCDEVVFEASRDGFLDGFCGHFAAELSPKVTLDTGPSSPPTFYRQRFFPLAPIALKHGDRVSVVVNVGPEAGAPTITLEGEVRRPEGSIPFSQSYGSW